MDTQNPVYKITSLPVPKIGSHILNITLTCPPHSVYSVWPSCWGVFLCCFCWYRSPVHEGCPNYEVVLFQPRTFPTLHLVSAAYCYSLIYSFCPTFFFSCFLDFFFPLSYLFPICSRSYFNTSEFSTPPHLIFCCESPTMLMLPAARYQTVSTACPCAACLRPMPLQWWCAIPFDALSLHPGPYQPIGDSLVTDPPRLCVTALSSPSFPPNLGIVRFCCPCRVPFRKKARIQGAYTPWKLRALVLTTRYLTIPALFRLPSYPLPSPLFLPPL